MAYHYPNGLCVEVSVVSSVHDCESMRLREHWRKPIG